MKIGPTFYGELLAAGLAGLPFSWGDDGVVQGRQNLTALQNAALDQVIAAHEPNKQLVPPVVSMLQARLALLGAGLLDRVNAAVAAADQATQISWEFATEGHRASPVIAA